MTANLGAEIEERPWVDGDPAVVLVGSVIVGRCLVRPPGGGYYAAVLVQDADGNVWALYYERAVDRFTVALHHNHTPI